MKGLKAVLDRVKTETDVKWLRDKACDIHRASDVAAFTNETREWNRLVEAESACLARIRELEEKAKGGEA